MSIDYIFIKSIGEDIKNNIIDYWYREIENEYRLLLYAKWINLIRFARTLYQLYPIDFSKFYSEEDINKLATVLYLLPEFNFKSIDEIKQIISSTYKNNLVFSKKGFSNLNIKNEEIFKFLINNYDSIKDKLDLIKTNLGNEKILKATKQAFSKGSITNVDQFLELFSETARAVTSKIPYKLQDTKIINGDKYDLYLALSPQGIKELANSGFNTWCINSLDYATSYFEKEITEKKGFWFIFKNNMPIFAIGGYDGISNTINRSLSGSTGDILESDYKILKEWNDKYMKYDLKKQNIITEEQLKDIISNIKNKINSNETIESKEWELLFTYSDKISDIDIKNLLNNVLSHTYNIRRFAGDSIEKSELLVYIAKFITKTSFEKLNIDQDILEKIQKIVGDDYNASIDYWLSVVKGSMDEKYKIYFDGLIDSIVADNDEDDLDDLDKVLKKYKENKIELSSNEIEKIKKYLINTIPDSLLYLDLWTAVNLTVKEAQKEYVKKLIDKGKYDIALGYIKKFNLQNDIEFIKSLIQKLIDKGKYVSALGYIKEFNLQNEFDIKSLIQKLIDRKSYEIALDSIKDFNLQNDKEFGNL